ncbi:MAG: branched-chain amino acid ABC transporter permease [Gammaproteobacteria bacterium]|nr:branched-chain amino acid ABC transporter permease [Gammaproteobacteria bacterium]
MRFVLKTGYGQDLDLFKHNGQRIWYGALMVAVLGVPFIVGDFYVGELSFVFIYAIAGIGLMLLVGYTGLVSLGHAAFLAIGAYSHAYLLNRGVPWPVAITLATMLSSGVGAIVAIPALRMTGIYLAVATLAFLFIVEQILTHWVSVTGGFRGMAVPGAEIFSVSLMSAEAFYYLAFSVLVCCLIGSLNVLRSPTGRAMIAIRDSEISAQSMGINLARTKTVAFALSAGFTGLAGALLAHKIGYLAPDAFGLSLSIQLLVMVVVGGLGSLHGVIYGAIFIGLLPQAIAVLRDVLPTAIGQIPGLEPAVFGAILIAFLIYEPLGIYGRWVKVRLFFSEFPLYRRATYKRQKSYLRTERVR